ncbi:MAG: hypothetical protein WA220_03885, partial [Candidatus Nitrosopolaris sp.]
ESCAAKKLKTQSTHIPHPVPQRIKFFEILSLLEEHSWPALTTTKQIPSMYCLKFFERWYTIKIIEAIICTID